MRAWALALCAGVFLIVPVAMFAQYWSDPESPIEAVAMLTMVLLPFASLVALVLLTRHVVHSLVLPPARRARLHWLCFVLGPIGCVWTVWEVTKRAHD